MVREIRNFSKVREKSGNFKIVFCSNSQKLNKHNDDGFNSFLVVLKCSPVILINISILVILMLKTDILVVIF